MSDWSLKGKRIHEPDCKRCSKENIYGEREIAILREKLIEDIIAFHDDITLLSVRDKHVLIELINKRFGVD